MITFPKIHVKKMSNKPVLTPRQYLLTHPDIEVDPRGFLGTDHVVPVNQTAFEKLDSVVDELNGISVQ